MLQVLNENNSPFNFGERRSYKDYADSKKLYNLIFPKKNMKKEWLEEIARDVVALGSPVFLFLVLVRVFILPDYAYLSQFIFASVIFFLSMFLFKQNLYSGLGFIISFFIILYYKDLRFGIFTGLSYTALVSSLFYLKKDWKEIIKGILLGALSTGISYYLVKIIFQ